MSARVWASAVCVLVVICLSSLPASALLQDFGDEADGFDTGDGSHGRVMAPDSGVSSVDVGDADVVVGVTGAVTVSAGGGPDDGGSQTVLMGEMNPDRGYPAQVELPCAEWLTQHVEVNIFGELVVQELSFPVCLRYLVCGAERVDDLVSGQRFDGVAGPYQSVFLQYFTNIAEDTGQVSGENPLGGLIAQILAHIGPAPSQETMVVFYWCQDPDDGTYRILGEEGGFSFGWDTTVTDEFPIDATIDYLSDRVRRLIGLYRPDPAAIPPLEVGYTYVKFPTWFWLTNPSEPTTADAQSGLGLVHVELRATPLPTIWHLGDTDLVCENEGMVAYHDGLDPIDDVPPCHHIFTTLDPIELSVTSRWRVEERVRTRHTTAIAFDDTAWVTQPDVSITTPIGNHEVHELHALVVNNEIDY